MDRLNDLLDLRMGGKNAAIISADETVLSYDDLMRLAQDMQEALATKGVAKRRIGVLVRQDTLNIVCLLAMSRYNTMVPINPSYRHEKLPGLIEDLGIDLIVTDTPSAVDCAQVPCVVIQSDGSFVPGTAINFGAGETRRVEHALIVPTSGSTGRPKLVGYTRAHIAASAQANIDHFQLSAQDVYLCPMPLFHAHGLVSVTIFTLCVGGTVVLSPASPTEIWVRMEKYNPTCFSAAPTIHQGLLRTYGGRVTPAKNLRFARSSSAPLPYSIFDQLEMLYGCHLIETYGLTESTSVVVANPLTDRRKGHVGKTIGETIANVLGQDGPRPVGKGELILKGPAIVQSYVDDSTDATQTPDEWFRTGDLVEINDEGFISVQGRLKEVVKRGGYGISPAEIDNVLCSISGVTAACTFSVDHPTLVEDLVSVVEVSNQADLNASKITDALINRLVTYKIPAAVHIVESIPRNAIGKIVRSDVRVQFIHIFFPPFTPARNPLEEQLTHFWEMYLSVEKVGVFDNIMLAGADPLLVSSLKENTLIPKITVPFLLCHPCVESQAKYLQMEKEK
jgi:acyl-CoA synthetase (AMP-forming)/AMP-acid ligase II